MMFAYRMDASGRLSKDAACPRKGWYGPWERNDNAYLAVRHVGEKARLTKVFIDPWFCS